MNMNNKNIAVVTGGTGLVGSHLVDLLLSKGYIVKCLVRKTSNLRWLKDKNVEIHDCGLFDTEKLKKVLADADYLYHIAGVVKSKKVEGYFNGNVETTRSLLEVVSEVNPNIKKIIIAGSLTACGPSLNGELCDENTKPHPITTYGRSKLAQEDLAASYMEKLPITICRAPAIYGERDTEIFLVFKSFKQGLMTMVGFNEKKISIIYVKDFVNGLFLAGTSEKSKSQIYFISSEKLYNWNTIGNAMEKAFGKKAFRIRLPHFLVYGVAVIAQFFSIFSSKPATFNLEKARDFVQENWTCNTSKAKNELGYSQKVSLEEGMKITADWYKEQKWL